MNDYIFNIDWIQNEVQEKSFTLLGVLFNKYLSFDDHILNLYVKIS